jgi:predicted Zn-dependent peptidase
MNLDTIDGSALGETVQIGTLPSGMRIALAPKPGFSTSAGHIGLRYGSTDTKFRLQNGQLVEVPEGSAHFLEHKLFEGREEKVFDRFGKLGAQFNGGTGFRSTNYWFQTANHFSECLEVLLDFVQHPLITESRVEKEKGIIEQEVRMYEDDPGYRGIFLLHRALYSNHPIRVTPGGPVSEVHRTTADDLQACFDAFYCPSNLVLSLSGDFDLEAVLAQVMELVDPSRSPEVERIYGDEGDFPAEKRLEERFAVTRPHVWLGWRDARGVGLGNAMLKRRVESSLVLDLALDHSSVHHERLYDQGVIDDTFQLHYSCDADWSYAVFSGQTQHPEVFLDGVRSALAKFLEEGPTEEDVERVRRAAWGSVVSGIQTPGALAGTVLQSLLVEQQPFSVLQVLEGISRESLMERAQLLFHDDRSAEAFILPE